MGQPVCHMSSKANVSVVGAAEGRGTDKIPREPPRCPGALDALGPQPKLFLA